jgi:hypothetical protein
MAAGSKASIPFSGARVQADKLCYDWGMIVATTLADRNRRCLSRGLWPVLGPLLLTVVLGSCMNLQKAREAAASLNSAQREQADALYNAGEYQEALEAYNQVLAEELVDGAENVALALSEG